MGVKCLDLESNCLSSGPSFVADTLCDLKQHAEPLCASFVLHMKRAQQDGLQHTVPWTVPGPLPSPAPTQPVTSIPP